MASSAQDLCALAGGIHVVQALVGSRHLRRCTTGCASSGAAARAGRPIRRRPSPDSQRTRSTPEGGNTGFDAGKKVKGRKHKLVVDTLGLVIAVTITPASVQDRDTAIEVVAQAYAKVLWLDTQFHPVGRPTWRLPQRVPYAPARQARRLTPAALIRP